jgi:hypothetical protein
MSNEFIIKSEKDLANFLRIVSEESYKKSLRENEYSKNYKSQFKSDAKLYNLSEQEEGEGEPPDEGGELVEPDKQEAGDDQEDQENETEDDIPTVSFEAIKSAINDLRASKSLRNQEASDSLSSFYEKLDDNEKLVLLSYLNTLTDILNLDGKGQDPSDPPLNIKMSSAEDEADEEAAADAEETAPVEAEEEPADAEEEDTSPPIELAENKNNNTDDAFRRKIRALML